MKKVLFSLCSLLPLTSMAQQKLMTPETLWQLGKVSTIATAPDGNKLIYKVAKTNLNTEKNESSFYSIDLKKNQQSNQEQLKDYQVVQWDKNGMYAVKEGTLYLSKDEGKSWTAIHKDLSEANDFRISPDGKTIAYSQKVYLQKVLAKNKYNDVPNSSVYVFTDLDYRHWDTWNDGSFNHIFINQIGGAADNAVDILKDEPYYAPQMPFGGAEDFVFSPDSKSIIYVCKKLAGKEYAQSTNTDLYAYNIESKTTENWTEGMMGYDMNPSFSPDGQYIAWKSMARDGFEADKNDIIILNLKTKAKTNLTQAWDETVDGDFVWSNDSKKIYFNAAFRGTQQLFELTLKDKKVKQITNGKFDVAGIISQSANSLIVSRTDVNHASELYSVELKSGKMTALTNVNAATYADTKEVTSELKMIQTKDGKEMGVWVIYPPDFDKTKKYPTLLYCQGGPQSALTQFFSVRWNFALMASNGYIVVAPNRRGMPGWGTAWNEAISKDWGGMPMEDYLSAIDYMAKEDYVDESRLGCVGASYGGYSTFMLAGIHGNRFKTFIAHNGLFDMKSWYGTTEELWFANWDLGGSYWQKNPADAYTKFNPSNYVQNWNAPIMIIQGGIDFRVPIGQGQAAFHAAQLQGIKSKMLYFPNENHWVLKAHNGLVWQREFFSWLKETL